jgi:hypothetical protein
MFATSKAVHAALVEQRGPAEVVEPIQAPWRFTSTPDLPSSLEFINSFGDVVIADPSLSCLFPEVSSMSLEAVSYFTSTTGRAGGLQLVEVLGAVASRGAFHRTTRATVVKRRAEGRCGHFMLGYTPHVVYLLREGETDGALLTTVPDRRAGADGHGLRRPGDDPGRRG